jgi:site-specific DNA-methyltransferase (adenine-specific)
MIRDYIRAEIVKAKGKVILKNVNQALGTATNGGGVASACLSLDKAEPAMLTKEMYQKLQTWCKPYLTKEYEELRKEYEELRRPFNNSFNLNEVLQYNTNTNNKYDHQTVKPETLTRVLIQTCSRQNDLVVVPFAGSGTECAMSVKEKRNFVGFEISEKHANMSNHRVNKILKTPTLF